jgi:hypothetical protein
MTTPALQRLQRGLKGSILDPARPLWTKAVSLAVFALVALAVWHTAHASGVALATNSFQYVDWLTMEGLRILKNKLVCGQFANMDHNEDYEQEFAVGQTIRVPLPQRWTVRDGLQYQEQPINRIYTTISCDQIFGIDFGWDSAEAALKMERGRERVRAQYLEPAMVQLAQEIDSRFALFAYQNTPNIVGVLGTDPTSFQTINQARQRMVELAGWMRGGPKGMIIPPSVNTSLVNAAIQYFNPASDISRQYREGSIGTNSGFDWYESMSLYSHTAGVWQTPSSVTISGSGQSGSTLLLNCTSGDTFNKGDVISIASVYAVNPVTRRRTTTATTKQFTITDNVTATASTVTVPIYPAIFGPGSQYQNVDALPVTTSLVTLFAGTTTPSTGPKSGIQGLALQRDAFMMVGVKLEMPKAVELSSQTRDPETGIAVRFVRAWDQNLSRMTNRFDVLMGFGVGYAENSSVRVLCA